MTRILRASTHTVANALLKMDEGPLRGFSIGKFFVSWEGKPGDVRLAMTDAETDAFFDDEVQP